MSTFKKVLALTLALAMVLSVSVFAGYKADTYKDAADIDADCADAIELMYALEIMKGDDKGNFNPKATITRGEMAKMIYVILNYGDDDLAVNYKGAKFFSDVNAGDWYEGYVNYMAMTKLVQGRPDGTFGPNDPVTTAEAAKMLLTALGYSAADRGYTGAAWAQNVLSDAAILELLKGYNYSTTGYAPRQWVAVMVENALDCYTIDTMKPTFGGLLISGVAGSYETMGAKYYGYDTKTGYITSISGYSILQNPEKVAGADEIVIDDKYVIEADATIEDLGQQFKVIYVVDDGDNVAISLRNTGKSVVAEAPVKDVEWELTYSTSANNEKNKYEFTVGEFTGKLTGNSVPVLNVIAGAKKGVNYDASDLKNAVTAAELRNDVVRAIDKDNDGDLDYVIYTPVDYAYVTKVGTSQKYGDYIKAKDMDDKALEISGNATLYIDSCIITEDELAVDNFFKFSWNIDEDMYNVEVLPMAEAVEYESRKINKDQYTFGGETYAPATNGYNTLEDTLKGKASEVIGVDYDIVVDGDLLVYIVETDSNTTLDEINAKLAVLIESDVNNVDDKNTKQVKLLTIDNEQAWYTYDATKASKNDSATVLTWAEVKPVLNEDDSAYDADGNAYNKNWGKLVVVYTNDDGEVYLEKVVEGDLVIDKEHDVVDKVDIETATLDVDGTPTFAGYRVAGDNKFFAYIDDEYTVITINELEEGEYAGVEAVALVSDGTYYDTVLGGYVIIGDATVAEDGYLVVVDTDKREDEDDAYIIVKFEGSEEEVELAMDDIKGATPTETFVYFYEYDGSDYTLTLAWEAFETLYVESGNELYNKVDGEYAEVDLADYDIIAVTVRENLRAEGDERWELQSSKTEFVDAETLAALLDECEGMLDEDDYTYSFDYLMEEYEAATDSNENETLWVVITKNMVQNETDSAE